MLIPIGWKGHGKGSLAEAPGQTTELINPTYLSQELTLLLEQNGTSQAHFSGACLL